MVLSENFIEGEGEGEGAQGHLVEDEGLCEREGEGTELNGKHIYL